MVVGEVYAYIFLRTLAFDPLQDPLGLDVELASSSRKRAFVLLALLLSIVECGDVSLLDQKVGFAGARILGIEIRLLRLPWRLPCLGRGTDLDFGIVDVVVVYLDEVSLSRLEKGLMLVQSNPNGRREGFGQSRSELCSFLRGLVFNELHLVDEFLHFVVQEKRTFHYKCDSGPQ